jgi:hypothetical protein
MTGLSLAVNSSNRQIMGRAEASRQKSRFLPTAFCLLLLFSAAVTLNPQHLHVFATLKRNSSIKANLVLTLPHVAGEFDGRRTNK